MTPLLKLLVAVVCVASTVTARQSMREIQIHKQLEVLDRTEGSNTAPGVGPKYKVYWQEASLPIDHSGEYPGNFSNRYWVMDGFYEPGGPVISFDTGESDGGHRYIGYLTVNETFFYQYLKEFKGMGIIWEHRYYGQSKPFPVNLDTPSEQMRFLTTENALKDFVVFANDFKWKNFTVSPKVTPWVVIGGSYPGMRAAFLRHLYPETVYAAWASSAPVQAQVDMSIYWEQVYRGMVRYNLGNCTRNVKLAVDYIDRQLSKSRTAAKLKQQYLGRTAEKVTNGGFADTLHYPFYWWQAEGVGEYLRSFCDHLTNGDSEVGPEWAKEEDGEGAGKLYSDRWASWPGYVKLVNTYNPLGHCEGSTRDETAQPNCLLDGRYSGDLGISWSWQYCSEWGYFQSTNIGPHALGSRYNNQRHQQEICYRQFPDGLSSGYLPRRPRVDKMNALTDGWNMRPSNVFWTGGEFDPWLSLSPLSQEKWSPMLAATPEAPRCGHTPPEGQMFGHLLENSEHCYELRSSVESATRPQEMFRDALKGWLKCFGK
ncbi:serine carboxypeptidase S28-domain-containing protein [Tricharina praecox]|uniref:serine carboxypeptidase S28-domain-containing protein n=1 Tax=Tricharina praecox TaxID=43433 RepID=UPI00221F2845|nr:serine carboxypeptidase S28-domain-containing protein [Tricharina praecox]KAI5848020.1 serine carboxypeptidase S28-domain-containing protein [Tricharina praecox]